MSDTTTDPMPIFVLKAKDSLAPLAVEAYAVACRRWGLDGQEMEVRLALDEILDWQGRNRAETKLPDHKHVPVDAGATREPSDLWQAVLITDGGRVVEPGTLAADDEWAICVVRRSLAPVDGQMPDPDDPACEDVAHCWQYEDSDDPDADVAGRYAMAQAMARGLNAGEAS